MENLLKIDDFEETASKVLSPEARNYYGQGTGTGETLKLNVETFKRPVTDVQTYSLEFINKIHNVGKMIF